MGGKCFQESGPKNMGEKYCQESVPKKYGLKICSGIWPQQNMGDFFFGIWPTKIWAKNMFRNLAQKNMGEKYFQESAPPTQKKTYR